MCNEIKRFRRWYNTIMKSYEKYGKMKKKWKKMKKNEKNEKNEKRKNEKINFVERKTVRMILWRSTPNLEPCIAILRLYQPILLLLTLSLFNLYITLNTIIFARFSNMALLIVSVFHIVVIINNVVGISIPPH